MLKSSIYLSFISLLIYLISLVSQLCIAYFFGASRDLDIFFLAGSIPTLIGALISSALSYSLVPHLIKKKRDLGTKYKIYIGFFIRLIFSVTFLTALFFVVFYLSVVQIIYPDLTLTQIKSLKVIAVLFSCNFIFGVLISFGNGFYNANNIYRLPLLLSSMPYCLTILMMFIFHEKIGLVSLVLGTLIGSIISFLILYREIPMRYVFQTRINRVFQFKDFMKTLFYAILAMLCFTFFQTSDSYWAFRLGPSNLSYLGYAQRILIALGSLIIIGPTTLLIPKLTAAFVEGRKTDFLKSTLEITKLVLSFSSFFAVVLAVLAKPLIKIVFERGSFTMTETTGVSDLFPNMLTGMVFMLCVVVLYRTLFIMEMEKHSAKIGLLCAIVYFLLSGLLSSNYGIMGITLAYVVTWVLIFTLTIRILFNNNLNIIFTLNNLIFVLKQGLTLLITYLLCLFLSNHFQVNSDAINIFSLLFSVFWIGLLCLISYFIIAVFVFRIDPILNLYLRLHKPKI
jgi:putative peptidoglycan lipid II flippase